MTRPVRSGAEFTIGDATPFSAPLISALAEIASGDAWSVDVVAKFLALPGSFGLIAQEVSQPLGFLLAQMAADEAEIVNIAVAPPARRRGIGAALVAEAAARARKGGAQKMFLEVASDNIAARALYERQGFIQAGMRPDYYHRGAVSNMDALILRLDLITIESD